MHVETLAHTAHVHADGVSHALGKRTGAAVSNFLINRDVGVDAALGLDAGVVNILGQPQQNAHGELVVQKAALDIARGGDMGAGIEADDVAV